MQNRGVTKTKFHKGAKTDNTRDSVAVTNLTLVWPSLAYVWESGRDPKFSSGCGRMWQFRPVLIQISKQTL